MKILQTFIFGLLLSGPVIAQGGMQPGPGTVYAVSGETFPSTSILDNFNRGSENPIAGGWSADPVYFGLSTARIVSNTLRARNTGSDTIAHPYWNTTFAANQEAYVTVADASVVSEVFVLCRATDVNTASYLNDLYAVRMTGGNFSLVETINSTDTDLATVAQALSSGDSLGIRCNGTTISGWYKASGGSWVKLLQVTDGSLTGSGFIGIMLTVTSAGAGDLDDFGGGEL